MSHSLTKIWIHAIFRTKNSSPLISNSLEKRLYSHIIDLLETELVCPVRVINGTENHVHILFLLNPNFALKEIIQKIKGNIAHWVNQNDFINDKFVWQIGYRAFSVSESKFKNVERYIKNQKEHHKKVTFNEEYEAFLKKYGLEILGNG